MRRLLVMAILFAAARDVPAGTAPELLLVQNAGRVEALAARGSDVLFAVGSVAPRQPEAESPPEFRVVRAGALGVAGSVVLGQWTEDGVEWLVSVPGDVASGGDSVFEASGLAPGPGSQAWVGGGRNTNGRPIGRFWIAEVDPSRGVIRRVDRDDGAAATGIVASGQALYVTRNPDRSAPDPLRAPRLERVGRWSVAVELDAASSQPSTPALDAFFWVPRGLDANVAGVWAVATFTGRARVAGRSVASPRPSELPVRGDFPPQLRQAFEQALRHQPLPPVPALLLLHADPGGEVRWLATATPNAVVAGDAAGGGFDVARVEGHGLVVDQDGNAYLLGRYEHAVRAGPLRAVVPPEAGMRCFAACWRAAGNARWLVHFPCDGHPIGWSLTDGGRLLAVTEHEVVSLVAQTGRVVSRKKLPVGEDRRGAGLRWTDAVLAGRRLVVAGLLEGSVTLAGKRVAAEEGAVLLLRLPEVVEK